MAGVSSEQAIRGLVKASVEAFAHGFHARHAAEVDDPDGIINMKIHNVFIEALGKDIQYYSSLVRSLDSSLGNMLESLAINIASLGFDVHKRVEGPLHQQQTRKIADLLEAYRRRTRRPSLRDYGLLKMPTLKAKEKNKRHDSDYYLIDTKTNEHFLIELKIGGDLDNKKARSEKEAIMEQYAILANTLKSDAKIKTFFATAYNRFGENRPWHQERVRQFFADEELLIGKDFWNFVCKTSRGYGIVLDEYRKNANLIKSALDKIQILYLGSNK